MLACPLSQPRLNNYISHNAPFVSTLIDGYKWALTAQSVNKYWLGILALVLVHNIGKIGLLGLWKGNIVKTTHITR